MATDTAPMQEADAATSAPDIRLTGVRAFDRVWDVRLEEGRVRVEEA